MLFDSGTIIGLMLFLEPLATVFLLIAWLGLINYGHFGIKQLLMPLTGILAVWFVVCSLIYWIAGATAVSHTLKSLAELPFGNFPEWRLNLWRVIPLVLLLVPAMYQLMNVYGKAKVLQRQSFGFLMILFVLLLIGGIVFYDPAGIWLWMSFPASALYVNLVKGLKRAWLKDVVYLVLLSYLALFLF